MPKTDIADNVHRYFATTVALITTNGAKHGPNIMAAEWTMHVSYEPMLVAVFVHESPTYWNMRESGVFGVNIASDYQAEIVNVAGGYSGTEISKLSIPGLLKTYAAKHFNLPMIRGCALNAECKVKMIRKVGDHIMVVGEALSAKFDEKRFPLIYTRGNYRKLSRSKIPSGRKVVRVTRSQMDEFQKLSGGKFVLKAAAGSIKRNGKVLLQRLGHQWLLPMVVVRKGDNYKKSLEQQINSLGVSADIQEIKKLARMTFKNGNSELRANFVIFHCKFKSIKGSSRAAWFTPPAQNKLLKQLLAEQT